jgi:hypothetical protein
VITGITSIHGTSSDRRYNPYPYTSKLSRLKAGVESDSEPEETAPAGAKAPSPNDPDVIMGE